jgi:outer membrane translocation and assembly module TamA
MLFPDDNLTLKRANYIGNELRTDGYYYRQKENVTYPYTLPVFFYRNGIVVSCGSFSTTDLNIVETEMPDRYDILKKYKDGWGVFLIDDTKIKYEKWIEAPSGVKLAVKRCSGHIKNDTTFHITESYNSGNGETTQVDEIWHFKQFANKPDSTNVYIK